MLHPLDEVRNTVTTREGSRTVYTNERTCHNCISHASCWESGYIIRPPNGFSLRRSWNIINFVPYFKTIYGGLCNNFAHVRTDLNMSFEAAERRRLDKQEIPEWEIN